MLLVSPTLASAADSLAVNDNLPAVAVCIVDTAGSGYLILRPLVEYQWLVPPPSGSVPRVRRVRSPRLVFEAEITSELRTFGWDEVRKIQPSSTSEGANRTLITLTDGQTFTCLTGFTQPGRVPALVSSSEDVSPSSIARTIKAYRLRAGQQVPVDIPWISVTSMEVIPLGDRGPTAITQLDALVQERARLYKRIAAIDEALSGLPGKTHGP